MGKINLPNLLVVCGVSGARIITDIKCATVIQKYAQLIVTDDCPAPLDPQSIRDELIKQCATALEIPNRFLAIQFALQQQKYSNILILGKSSEVENIIKYQDYWVHYNERQFIKNIIDGRC